MAYRLKEDESVPQGLRRIAREEIDSAVQELRGKDPGKRDEAIHEARKSIKKLRGLIRILMPGLGPEGKRENTVLRDLGRTLSEIRDAAALVEMAGKIRDKYRDEPAAARLQPVLQELNRQKTALEKQTDPAAAAEQAAGTLRNLKRRVNSWKLDSDGFSAIEPGLKRTYRQGRKALARAEETSKAEDFHELRKRVKDHWYHVRLLESTWTEPLSAREKVLKELQEWLGDDHNLVVLHEKVAAQPGAYGDDETVAGLNDLIDRYQRELRENSVSEARRIYGEKPRRHVRRLRGHWEAWREPPKKIGAKTAGSAAKRARPAA